MKKLVKMKLINWHLFSNETIEIKNNVVITGENGSGKSTLLDAMQYVLTAGKAKFNSAANDSGKRSIDGYIRGKLGREGKEYLRTGDVVSYIALEYYDEMDKKSKIIGVVLELNKSDIKKELFFHIKEHKIEDTLFFNGKHIYNRSEFQNQLNKGKISYYTANKKSEVPNLFKQALGVTSKYFEMIPKALAFKPINQVYNFIFDFLLNEDPVKIDELRNNVHAYRDLGNVLKEQEAKLDALEKVNQSYSEYKNKKMQLEDYRIAKNCLYVEGLNYQKNQIEFSNEKKSGEVKLLELAIESLKTERDQLQKEIFDTENILENNESYKLKKNLEMQYDVKHREFSGLKTRHNEYTKKLLKESKLLKQLRIKEKFIQTIEEKQYDSHYLNDNLSDIKNDLNEKEKTYLERKFEAQKSIEKMNEEQAKLKVNLQTIERNCFQYQKEVSELINVLKHSLSETFQKKVEVRPLCEYLDIKDETWRNAIEGYLNTQRFDIVLDPEYFNEAIRIYEQYKESKGIYGIGIVDVAKLEKYHEEEAGSLASYVTSINTYAKNYANMLMNRVKCVEHVDELPMYKTAITKTCMVYKNYTVRAINPSIYKRPFIGRQALLIQKQQIEERMQQLNEELKIAHKQNKDADYILKIISESEIKYLLAETRLIDEYNVLEKEIKDIQTRISEINHDDSIWAIDEQLNKLKTKSQLKSREYEEKLNHKANLHAEIQRNKEIYETIILELEKIVLPELIEGNVQNIMERYRKNYGHQYTTIQNQLTNRISSYEKELQNKETDVESAMKSFNHDFKVGYEETIQTIDIYLQLHDKLKNIEISKRQEDVRIAKRKCEQSFQESFISRLNEKIVQAKKDIKELNSGLITKDFNGDRYEFEVNPSKRKEYRKYYDIIVTNQQYTSDNLFVTTLSQENRAVMDELFTQLSLLDENENSEKLLQKYTDYREYLDYDIKISHDNGDATKFSKVNREKSGGETQTPFYVVIASSFEQLIKKRMDEDSGCVVLFDEAFNNMDETRIQAMMNFYNELNVQIILAVPPTRASTIMPYVDTTLAIIKSNDHSFVEAIIHEPNV